MMNATVILKRILLENFKNVKRGEISLVHKDENGACIAGIYGQNGSGKTAIIEALVLLRHCLVGYSMPQDIANYFISCINVDSESARLEFEFAIENNDNIGIDTTPAAGEPGLYGGVLPPDVTPELIEAAREIGMKDKPYTVLNIISLLLCIVMLTMTLIMSVDLVRNMWSWNQPFTINSQLMDWLLSYFN